MKTNFNYTWDVFFLNGFSIFYVSLLELKEYTNGWFESCSIHTIDNDEMSHKERRLRRLNQSELWVRTV